jgi:ABC-2 type transport system permease protein
VRRELWETRSLSVGPLAVAHLVLQGFSIRAVFTLPARVASLATAAPGGPEDLVAAPYSIAAMMVILVTYLVGAFYCLDALYSERRDRSILFWKSLPVSDSTAVLAKASIPLVVLPAIAFAVTLATQLAMSLWSTVLLAMTGGGVATLWSRLPLVEMAAVMAYGLAVHALWHAPLYAWLLLVSAWARRFPLLWAVLPPISLAALDGVTFQSSSVCAFMTHRVTGAMKTAFALEGNAHGRDIRLEHLDPIRFLATPGLWLGLAVAFGFLYAAFRLRRRGEPL